MNYPVQYVEFSDKSVVNLKTSHLDTENLGLLEVVIHSEASLISAGTELSELHGIEPGMTYPRRTGYANIGRILAKGAGVTDFEVGQRVFFAGKHASVQRFLHGQNHQWGRLYPVPEDLPAEDAAFVCLAEIAMTAPCVTQLCLNDTVAVFGLGLIGNLAAQMYQILGARVIALDPVEKRCELARQTGLTTVLNVPAEQQVKAVHGLTEGRGAEVTVEATGHSAVVQTCVEATALFGQIVLLGTPRAPYQSNLTPILRLIHEKGQVMRGAHMWRFPACDVREVKQTVPWGYRTMFDLMISGKLKVPPLRSHFIKPERATEVYRGLKEVPDRYWGVVFDWSE